MWEVIGFVVSIVIIAFGIAIANRAISLEFFDDPLTVKAIKIFTVLAYFGGIGAAVVGNMVIVVIGITMGIVGYFALNRIDPPKK